VAAVIFTELLIAFWVVLSLCASVGGIRSVYLLYIHFHQNTTKVQVKVNHINT